MYTSFISNNYSNISSGNDYNHCYVSTTSSSSPNWSEIAVNVNPYMTYLTRPSLNDVIATDDIVTRSDLTENFLWQALFKAICDRDPDKMPDYMTTFKLYNEDYKNTVIAIETAKKEE